MNPRYIRQKGNWDCGPTAIINVMKWAGFKASYAKHAKYLNRMMRPDGFGSSILAIHTALTHTKKKRFWFRYQAKPTLKKFIDHLHKGGCVMFVFWTGQNYHVCLITEMNSAETRFLFINPFDGHTSYQISRTRLKIWLRAHKPVAWLVHRYSNAEG